MNTVANARLRVLYLGFSPTGLQYGRYRPRVQVQQPAIDSAQSGPGYINTAALTPILVIGGNGTPGTGGTGWGDAGVGVIFGPGQLNFDTTLAKTTRGAAFTKTQ